MSKKILKKHLYLILLVLAFYLFISNFSFANFKKDNQITYRVFDKSGNYVEKSTSIQIDKTPPQYSHCNKSGQTIYPFYTDNLSGINWRRVEYWSLWDGHHNVQEDGFPTGPLIFDETISTSSSIGIGLITNIRDYAGNENLIDLRINFTWCNPV